MRPVALSGILLVELTAFCMFTESHGVHNLALGSRRRRRLLLLYQPDGLNEATRVQSDDEQSAPVAAPADRQKLPHGVLLIRDMLEDAAPRTWLFAGDTLGFDARQSQRGWVELFADSVKVELQRSLDVVLDTAVQGSLVATLRRNLDWRVLRFNPDVVFLMPGPRESVAAQSGRRRFELELKKTVERLEEEGVVVVLCTPPQIPGSEDRFCDLPAYVDLVRQVAGGTDALLIDHWQHWSQLETRTSLLDADQDRPNFSGHRKLAQYLLSTIGMGDV